MFRYTSLPNNNRSCIQDFFFLEYHTELSNDLEGILTFPKEYLRLLISGVNIAHPFVFSQLFYDSFEIFMFYFIKLLKKSSAAVGSAAVPLI